VGDRKEIAFYQRIFSPGPPACPKGVRSEQAGGLYEAF
jgi:hypothetical protein